VDFLLDNIGPSHGDRCLDRYLHRTSCYIRMPLLSELIYDDTVSSALLSCSEYVDSIGVWRSSHF
jgi:hypothetical protein